MNTVMNVGNKFRCIFGDIQNLGENRYKSDNYSLGGSDWNISIGTKMRDDVRWLAIYLGNDSIDTKQKNMICEFEGEYRLMNQTGSAKNRVREVKSCLKRDFQSWGFVDFIEWDNLISPENGFIDDDSIVIEMEFDFKLYDFSEKIPNFTDITINVEDTDFHVNRWVLCSKSEYFYDLFVNKKNEDTVIQLDDIKSMDLCYILASLDSSFDGVSHVNYEEVLEIAIKFKVSSLHHIIEQFLIDETRIEKMEKIKYFEEYGYEKLMKSCIKSLKTGGDIQTLHNSSKFATLKETTKLRIMQRFLDIY